MKYIIEVPEGRVVDGFLRLLGVMEGVKSHWIETGIRATPYEEPSDTAEDAWKMISHVMKYADAGGMSIEDLEECFGTNNLSPIGKMSYVEVREKYDAWRKKKGEIHVGDEIYDCCVKGVVTYVDRIDNSVAYQIVGQDGATYCLEGSAVIKSGRHFPEVAELLKKMGGSE